jgi:phosphoribosylformylglycinamidine cyclo-ligase
VTGEGPYTYADAGVDLYAAEGLTSRLASLVESTRTDRVRGEFGSFGGRFRLGGSTELVASADGVGTKVMVAGKAGRHDTIGQDLVNHCVDDILTEGAEPLFFLDYFACGRLNPDVAHTVVEGVARACRENGCALLGGETAEMPGLYAPGDYDLAGFVVGRVVFDLPGRESVMAGDRLVGLPSTGLHTNGYSLARGLLFDRLGLGIADEFPGAGATVGEVLLRVHRSYFPHLRAACSEGRIRALAHITGGGLPGNLSRVLPPDADAVVDLGTWDPGPVFSFLAAESGMDTGDLFRALNMGIGMVAVVERACVDDVLESVRATGLEPFVCGEIRTGSARVVLES